MPIMGGGHERERGDVYMVSVVTPGDGYCRSLISLGVSLALSRQSSHGAPPPPPRMRTNLALLLGTRYG